MRALFLKEFLQGRLFLLFGPLLGVLAAVLWLLIAGVIMPTSLNADHIDALWGIACYLTPVVIALFAGAGIFAGEIERDTLPVLLSLPLSRRRIWAAKALAGLALAASAGAALLLINALVMLPEWRAAKLTPFLPDIAIWIVVAFALALFCSTLCTHTISALLLSLLTGLALFIGAAFLVGFLGGGLLGYDPILDLSLWTFAAIPALLAASFMGFSRGDLLRSWRKWAFALHALVIVLAAVCLPIVGLARWLTRYDRSRVEQMHDISFAHGSPVTALTALASPVIVTRDSDRGWLAKDASYRSRTLVLVNLDTGADIWTHRGGGRVAISPDGRFAAMLLGPAPITWGYRTSAGRPLEVWDLQQNRLLYHDDARVLSGAAGRGTVLYGLSTFRHAASAWSPDASWLALEGWLSDHAVIVLMPPDGALVRTIEIIPSLVDSVGFVVPPKPWDWSHDGEALYALDRTGQLIRHTLVDGRSHVVWDPRRTDAVPQRYAPRTGTISAAPDGSHIAVALLALPDRYTTMEIRAGFRRAAIKREAVFLVFVVSTDGSGRLLIRRTPVPEGLRTPNFTWSPDGRRLYFVDPRPDSRALLQWSAAPGEATPVPLNLRSGWPQLVPVPEMGGVMIWDVGRLWLANDGGEVIPFPDERVRAAVADYYPMGLDNRGRLIVRTFWADEPQMIAAVDLHTGELTRIYP